MTHPEHRQMLENAEESYSVPQVVVDYEVKSGCLFVGCHRPWSKWTDLVSSVLGRWTPMLDPLVKYTQEHAIVREDFLDLIESESIDEDVRFLTLRGFRRNGTWEQLLPHVSVCFPSLQFLLLRDCASCSIVLATHLKEHPSSYACVAGEKWEDIEELRVALGNDLFFSRVVWLNTLPSFVAQEATWDDSVNVDRVNPVMERTHVQFGDVLTSLRRIPMPADLDSD